MRDRGHDECWAEHQASRRTRWQSGSEYVDTDQRAGRMLDQQAASMRDSVTETQPSPPTSMELERMRRAAKIDATQSDIVDALRAVGAHVTSLAAVGGGVPDLLVSRAARWYLLEVKDGNQPPSARLLTPEQKRWHAAAQAPVHIANSVSDALAIIGCGPKAAA